MCDFRAGDLIVSYDVRDLIADDLIHDIRHGRVNGVKHASALKERLRSLGETEDLPWHLHLLRVDEGDEVLMINTLYQEYMLRSSRAQGMKTPVFQAKSHSKTVDTFHVALNGLLSLCGPGGRPV